jgi:hypothetical protein
MVSRRTSLSVRQRLVLAGVGTAAVAVIGVDLWAHPEFGPPILFGFSLSVVGLVGGVVLAGALLAARRRSAARGQRPR